jgi:hypothetical protein
MGGTGNASKVVLVGEGLAAPNPWNGHAGRVWRREARVASAMVRCRKVRGTRGGARIIGPLEGWPSAGLRSQVPGR